MKRNLPNRKIFSSIAVIFTLVGLSFAQTADQKNRRNSPFAPNPKGRLEIARASSSDAQNISNSQKFMNVESSNQNAETATVAGNESASQGNGEADANPPSATTATNNASSENRSTVKKDLEAAKKAASAASPSEIYKVGANDILFISLQNAPATESTYFTVSKDGVIDYPLAGEMVSVAGMTTDEIAATLEEKIKLYENPDVSVKVREHNSHGYTVFGMVEKPGAKFLEREAYPLLVVKTEAVVQEKADHAIIKRSDSQTETIDLKDAKSDDVLIFSGDSVEFTAIETKQYFYIGGDIVSGGQKDFLKGMTLTQAILASGGTKKQSVKRVIVRHRNEAGMLTPINYDLKSIKDGKIADPEIKVGDTIEVEN